MPGSSTGASSLPQLLARQGFSQKPQGFWDLLFSRKAQQPFQNFCHSDFFFQIPGHFPPRDAGPPPSNSGTKTALLTGIVLAVHPAGTPGFPGFFPFFEGTPALLESPFQEGWEPFFQTGSLPFCLWGRREGPFSTAHNCAIIVALFEKILAKKRGAVYHASDCVCKGGKHWLGPPVF